MVDIPSFPISPKMRVKALENAYQQLMKRQNMGAMDEPFLLFGALMNEILTLESRVAKLEGNSDV